MNNGSEDLKVGLSKRLAREIVSIHKLLNTRREYVMSNQILRSGTSVGANIAEARFASSKADFCNKISISRKEASETMFWLELLEETGYLSTEESANAKDLTLTLVRMLTSVLKTANPLIR